MAPRVLLPAWVVPTIEAVQECDRVAQRIFGAGPSRSTSRDRGVAAALAWLMLGEASPMTDRAFGEPVRSVVMGSEHDATQTWTSGVTWEAARAESWVALSVAAGQRPPTVEDWRLLGVEPAAARVDDREFAYGVWRALSWLLGVRDDPPIYTSWHRAAGLRPERPYQYERRRHGEDPGSAWRAAEAAVRGRAETEAQRWWSHVRTRV